MPRHAWLTPDLILLSAPAQCRTIRLPGDLWQYVTGALLPLTHSYNWEAHGSATPDETAEFFQQVFEDHLVSMCAYIGEIRPFTFTPLPAGWLLLDGTAVSATTYADLAAVVPLDWISGAFIELPDLQASTLIGAGGAYNVGDTGGEIEHTLTVAEMPAHDHTYETPIVTADIKGELPAAAVDAAAPAVTGSAGSGDPHNNMPPFLVVYWGIFAGET